MRSGLKHLLAYQLTKPNKQCYLISKRFVFQPIKIIMLGSRTACIKQKTAMTIYDKGYIVLHHDTVTIEWYENILRIKNNTYMLKYDEKIQAMNLYNNHQFTELMAYCKDKR
jgi:hypothetical protein